MVCTPRDQARQAFGSGRRLRACDARGRSRGLFCDRHSPAEIAERLRLSRRTVEKHIEHVYLKLRVHDRRGLREESILADALHDALGDCRC